MFSLAIITYPYLESSVLHPSFVILFSNPFRFLSEAHIALLVFFLANSVQYLASLSNVPYHAAVAYFSLCLIIFLVIEDTHLNLSPPAEADHAPPPAITAAIESELDIARI